MGGEGGGVHRGPFMRQKQDPRWGHDGASGC